MIHLTLADDADVLVLRRALELSQRSLGHSGRIDALLKQLAEREAQAEPPEVKAGPCPSQRGTGV